MWGLGSEMKEPVRWLKRQITGGKMRARRVGRTWYMTDADIAHNLDQLANTTTAATAADVEPAAPAVSAGLSARSARYRLAVAR